MKKKTNTLQEALIQNSQRFLKEAEDDIIDVGDEGKEEIPVAEVDEKVQALAKFLEVDIEEAKEEIESERYLVLTDAEADEKCAEYVKDSLWAFNADFILQQCDLPTDEAVVESIKSIQEKLSESANEFFLALVEKCTTLESFTRSAISADGRGHFMSSYDGEENEQEINGTYYFIYKMN